MMRAKRVILVGNSTKPNISIENMKTKFRLLNLASILSTAEMRLLAIDYGRKRIGIALSDPLGITVQPLKHLSMSPNAIEQIKQIIIDQKVQKVVMGLPLTMQGNDSEMTTEVREFTKKLEPMINVPVTLYDESCTSDAANRMLIESNISRDKRKELVDSIAAAILLQSYLEEHGKS